MLLTLFALGFAVVYFGMMIILWIGLTRINTCSETKLFRVSIIIAMKNEMQNVRTCLDALVNQNYPRNLLEIVIVDDGSTDNTPTILTEYAQKFSYIKIIRNESTPPGVSSKKYALSKAIAQSKGEILLLTDADCKPQSGWIRAMVSCFDSEVGFVAGFSPLIDSTNSILGNLLLLDSIANGIVAAGSIGFEKAITCTGRNIAYRREVYNEVNGFNKIMRSISGDDDLFLQLVKRETKWKIRFAKSQESIVPSVQTKNLKQFLAQKRRHLSAGKYYDFKLQIAYVLFHSANLFITIFFIISIFTGQNIILAIFLLTSKLLIDWRLMRKGSRAFFKLDMIKYLPLWELFFLGYHLIIGPASWSGKIKWK